MDFYSTLDRNFYPTRTSYCFVACWPVPLDGSRRQQVASRSNFRALRSHIRDWSIKKRGSLHLPSAKINVGNQCCVQSNATRPLGHPAPSNPRQYENPRRTSSRIASVDPVGPPLYGGLSLSILSTIIIKSIGRIQKILTMGIPATDVRGKRQPAFTENAVAILGRVCVSWLETTSWNDHREARSTSSKNHVPIPTFMCVWTNRSGGSETGRTACGLFVRNDVGCSASPPAASAAIGSRI